MRNVKVNGALSMTAASAAVLAFVAACGSSSTPSASTDSSNAAGKETLKVALQAVGDYNAPLDFVVSQGFDKQVGLQLSLTNVGSNASNVVVAGQYDLALVGLGAALPPVSNGKDMKIIYNELGGQWYVIGRDNIKTVAGCKRIATPRVGGFSNSLAQQAKEVLKFKAQIVPLSDNTTIVPSVVSGQNDCAAGVYSTVRGGNAPGVHLVVDSRDPSTIPAGLDVFTTSSSALFGVASNLESKRTAVVKLMKALKLAVDYIKTTPSEQAVQALTNLPDYKSSGLTAAIVKPLYEADKAFFAPNGGRFDEKSWAANIKLITFGIPQVGDGSSKWNFDQRVDNSYLDAAGG
jgi:uncharacterized membrane protein